MSLSVVLLSALIVIVVGVEQKCYKFPTVCAAGDNGNVYDYNGASYVTTQSNLHTNIDARTFLIEGVCNRVTLVGDSRTSNANANLHDMVAAKYMSVVPDTSGKSLFGGLFRGYTSFNVTPRMVFYEGVNIYNGMPLYYRGGYCDFLPDKPTLKHFYERFYYGISNYGRVDVIALPPITDKSSYIPMVCAGMGLAIINQCNLIRLNGEVKEIETCGEMRIVTWTDKLEIGGEPRQTHIRSGSHFYCFTEEGEGAKWLDVVMSRSPVRASKRVDGVGPVRCTVRPWFSTCAKGLESYAGGCDMLNLPTGYLTHNINVIQEEAQREVCEDMRNCAVHESPVTATGFYPNDGYDVLHGSVSTKAFFEKFDIDCQYTEHVPTQQGGPAVLTSIFDADLLGGRETYRADDLGTATLQNSPFQKVIDCTGAQQAEDGSQGNGTASSAAKIIALLANSYKDNIYQTLTSVVTYDTDVILARQFQDQLETSLQTTAKEALKNTSHQEQMNGKVHDLQLINIESLISNEKTFRDAEISLANQLISFIASNDMYYIGADKCAVKVLAPITTTTSITATICPVCSTAQPVTISDMLQLFFFFFFFFSS